MSNFDRARKPGARDLDEIEAELRSWITGAEPEIPNASCYWPISDQEPWPVREILVELLEGHGVGNDT